jgi:acetyl-CoA C-acetyltransferase
MTKELQTPVLVGVGQVLQRVDDPLEGAEPLEMMIDALGRAAEDCGAPSLLAKAESVRVIRGVWRYGDPGREIARRLGLGAVETMGSPWGGNVAQACVSDAAREIQSGQRRVVLVTGAENGRSRALARRQGVELAACDAPGEPDRMLMPEVDMAHPAELARGVRRATDAYAVFESAVRSARGESLEEHSARIAELWSGFNAVACQNPNAWIRKPYTASQIGTAGPENPMIALPYPRLMNANNRVDMGAGLILCSLDAAREAGVPAEKLVFLHAGTQANDSYTASERRDFHRSPAIRLAGKRALELARVSAGDVEHIDLYSCFPSAVQVAAQELGLAADRPLTVTGGLTFGGGPLNDYVLHSIARMAERLRKDRGARGLVTANGGLLAKHAFGVYSTTPPVEGFRFEDLQQQADAEPRREAVVDWDGPVRIESYTVTHENGEARRGYAACLTPDGVRTWAATESPELMAVMTREELCGRPARIDGRGTLDF